MDYMNILNKEQYKAVTTNSQYVRVNAGAGSGKTRVLASRIAFLIDQFGISEHSILAITFTNKVAKEMKERVCKMLEKENTYVSISTFHSFCVRVLRENISVLEEGYNSRFTIIDDEDQEKIIKEIIKESNVSKEYFPPKKVLGYICTQKSEGHEPSDLENSASFSYESKIYLELYKLYDEYLHKHQYLDFDDLLMKAVKILYHHKDIRAKWQRRFQYILVDEFQDTNDIQYDLLRLLCSPETSLFVVGDPDQTIYTWRGANVNLILNFDKDFPNTEDIVLFQNYRSTKSILHSANKLITNNVNRLKKDLLSNQEDGEKVLYFQASNAENEAKWVLDKINEIRALNKEVNYKDFTILYRSSYYSRALETELINYKYPYRIFGGIRFFQRKEIKDVLAYLRLVVNHNDEQALLRIINEPKRGVGDKSISNLKVDSKTQDISIYEIVKGNVNKFKKKELISNFVDGIEQTKESFSTLEDRSNFSLIFDWLLKKVGYMEYLENEDEADRLDNVKELKQYLQNLYVNNPDLTLNDILQDVQLYSAQDDMENGDYISLMTVHTAKGLEFPYVFIVGASENVFPNARALEESKYGVEEERRLFYVAITRAMKKLFICDNMDFDFTSKGNKRTSRFVKELGDTCKRVNPPRKDYFSSDFDKLFIDEPRYKKPEPRVSDMLSDKVTQDFRRGQLVEHIAFGEGIIIDIEGEGLRIAFKKDGVGTKFISKKFKGLSIK